MIKSLQVKNFRGFGSLEIKELNKFNLLVGHANTGKTTLMEAIFLLLGVLNPKLAISINGFRGLEAIDQNYWARYFHDLKMEQEISIAGEITGTIEELRKLTITPKLVSHLRETENGVSAHTASDYASTSAAVPRGLLYCYDRLKAHAEEYETFRTELVEEEKGTAQWEPSREHDKFIVPAVFLSAGTLYSGLASRFAQMAEAKLKPDLLAVLSLIDKDILDLELGQNNVLFCDVGLPKMLPVNLMGGGVIKVLSALTAFADCSKGVLLLDELENGLHFSAQEILWRALYEAANKFDVQIIASTHSYECVRAFQAVAKERLDLYDDFSLFRLEKHDHSPHVVRIDMNDLETAIKSHWEVR